MIFRIRKTYGHAFLASKNNVLEIRTITVVLFFVQKPFRRKTVAKRQEKNSQINRYFHSQSLRCANVLHLTLYYTTNLTGRKPSAPTLQSRVENRKRSFMLQRSSYRFFFFDVLQKKHYYTRNKNLKPRSSKITVRKNDVLNSRAGTGRHSG